MAGRLLWNDLDRPLKLSALSGVVGGGLGLIAGIYGMISGGLSFFFEGIPGGFFFGHRISVSSFLVCFPVNRWFARRL